MQRRSMEKDPRIDLSRLRRDDIVSAKMQDEGGEPPSLRLPLGPEYNGGDWNCSIEGLSFSDPPTRLGFGSSEPLAVRYE